MKLDLIDSWTVRIDVDAVVPGSGRHYRRHVNVLVLCATAERAIEITRQHYPESSIWSVNHAHKDAVVLYDGSVVPSPSATTEKK